MWRASRVAEPGVSEGAAPAIPPWVSAGLTVAGHAVEVSVGVAPAIPPWLSIAARPAYETLGVSPDGVNLCCDEPQAARPKARTEIEKADKHFCKDLSSASNARYTPATTAAGL